MKTTKLFFMAALALLMTACSNNDDELTLQPAEQPANNMITITAKLAPKSGSALTRAVSESGGNIVVDWAQNEKLKIISGSYTATANIDAVDGSGTATISFSIEAAAVNQNCTIVYPASAATATGVKSNSTLLTAQDGTLSANLDVRVGEGKILSTGTLDVTTQPETKFAIWKLTLDKTAKDLYITANGELIAGAICSSAGTEFTVAVPAVSSKTVTVVATDGTSDCWFYSKAGVSLAAGKYYQSTPTMTALDGDYGKPAYKVTGNVDVAIAAGKTVVLSGANLSGSNSVLFNKTGEATLIVMGTNTIAPTSYIPIEVSGSGTLTITGTGSLTVQAAGINISGIAGTTSSSNIIICGGTINATGGENAPGIGSLVSYNCGTITITDGVTSVTSTKGAGSSIDCIGRGYNGNCGTITIGDVVYWDGSAYQNGGDTYLTQNSITYSAP